ncbi:MAG: hypothetical protein N2654_05060 [Deltaproteobacteria bacterium]|nr:hypothetical protein [Deltaproteobacteria bacterium]
MKNRRRVNVEKFYNILGVVYLEFVISGLVSLFFFLLTFYLGIYVVFFSNSFEVARAIFTAVRVSDRTLHFTENPQSSEMELNFSCDQGVHNICCEQPTTVDIGVCTAVALSGSFFPSFVPTHIRLVKIEGPSSNGTIIKATIFFDFTQASSLLRALLPLAPQNLIHTMSYVHL